MSGKVITPIFLILMTILTGCRNRHDQPKDNFSVLQENIQEVLGSSDSGSVHAASFAKSIHTIVSEYYQAIGTENGESEAAVDRMIDSALLYLSSKLFMQTDPVIIIREMNTLIFEKWGITFNDDRNNVEYLFPHLVLKNREGSCVGISLLYLLIAEKNGTPLHGVLVPGHFYVRYDDGMSSFNIETLRKGENMPVSWYRDRYGITDTALYDMRKLETSETDAVIEYNIGTILFQMKRYDAAKIFLDKSLRGMPEFPEAKGNLALVLSETGQHREALDMLTSLKKRYPSLKNVNRNIASLQLRCEEYGKALSTYNLLLETQPENAEFLYGKGLSLFKMGQMEEAERILKAALAAAPKIPEITELLTAVKNARRE